MTGTLFETPTVIEDAKKHIEAAGLAGRYEMVAGDFFVSVPEGEDAYLLAHVLQSFDDNRSIAILRNCRHVMPHMASCYSLRLIISRGNTPSFAKLFDLHMLVITGGRQRTEVEYGLLLGLAGLRLTNAIATESGESGIEAVRL